MPTGNDRTIRRMDRRRLIRVSAGIVAAWLGLRAEEALGLDTCFWETRQVTCNNGRRREYRCEVCCAGGVCETVQCLWVDAGPC